MCSAHTWPRGRRPAALRGGGHARAGHSIAAQRDGAGSLRGLTSEHANILVAPRADTCVLNYFRKKKKKEKIYTHGGCGMLTAACDGDRFGPCSDSGKNEFQQGRWPDSRAACARTGLVAASRHSSDGMGTASRWQHPPPTRSEAALGGAPSTLPGGVGRRLLPVSLCPPKPAPPGHMSPVAAALWPGAQITGRAGQAAPAPPTPWEARGRLPTAQASAPQSLRW